MVTAGCGGVGVTIARTLTSLGARVIATSRDAGRAADFEAGTQGRILGRVLQFEPQAAAQFVSEVVEELGSLDVLVNAAAGRTAGTSVEQTKADDMLSMFRDGCVTAFVVSQATMAAHARTGTRSIINIGSIYGSLAVDHRIYDDPSHQTAVAYACAKGALVQLTRYLAAYWAPLGVRVNSVSAGGIKRAQAPGFYAKYSARVPMGRMADPEEIAGAVAFLACDSSSYITGLDLIADGGLHVW